MHIQFKRYTLCNNVQARSRLEWAILKKDFKAGFMLKTLAVLQHSFALAFLLFLRS